MPSLVNKSSLQEPDARVMRPGICELHGPERSWGPGWMLSSPGGPAVPFFCHSCLAPSGNV